MLQTQTNLAWDTLLTIDDRHGSGPLHVRLTQALRDAIRSGRIRVGSALPPSRQLAADLGCSRWVVTEAFEQLVGEGYLEARVGSGTRVRLADHERRAAEQALPHVPEPPRFNLRPGVTDLRAFPRAAWIRAMRETLATLPPNDLGYPPHGGQPRLRQVLAEYLRRVRGAVVRAEDVTITSGILDGITQLTRVCAAANHRSIGLEDPGWTLLFQGVRRTGLEIVPIGIDSNGIRTDELLVKKVRAVLVAPAHQFPTGAVLTAERRAELLEWVRATDGLILEDDYDAEFRYDRRPIGALQGLDPRQVALFGSLSKTLAPGLGLGWAVTPPRWTEALRAAETRMTGPSTVEQLTLARFIETGAYDRHLRALRRTYRARRDRLVAAVVSQVPECEVTGAAAGLHVLVRLPDGLIGAAVAEAARERGVGLLDLQSCRLNGPGSHDQDARGDIVSYQGLVLGYANLDEGAIEEAIAELACALRTVQSRRHRK
jgi:GntR family transcriptional regulator / MocR family aminotransferase